VKETGGAGHWQRFFHSGGIHLIQCAEQLEKPVEIVEKTYSNCTWQNGTLGAAEAVAAETYGRLYDFGMQLGLSGYPESADNGEGPIPKSAFQYLENHDHPRFVCNFGTDSLYREVLREGKRDRWFRLQPFAIGLLLGRGIPMLWEGQEVVENYDVPDSGPARIGTLRPVRWERFYDHAGQSMIRLYRRLIALRRDEPVFRRGSYFFFNNWEEHQQRGVIVFERSYGNDRAVVALNFSPHDLDVPFTFRHAGEYYEQLHGQEHLFDIHAGSTHFLHVPSHYGRVWLCK
jgi:glycosidase